MRYRRLGQTGVKVSSVGLGSWLTVDRHGQEVTDALHRTAYENGINFFDTANVYGDGETEAMVAKALAPFRRDTYVLATKVYFPFGQRPFPGVNDHGLSRKHIHDQCARSLCELRTEYIDLYQCHRFDEETPLAETCRAMNDLIERGMVLYWGVSQWQADQIREAVEICEENGWHRPVSNQPQYNMLQRQPESEVFPTCAELGLGLVVFSPLAQGVLTGKYRPGKEPPAGSRATVKIEAQWMESVLARENLVRADKLSGLASGMGITTAQLALAWCLRRSELTSCIVGATLIEQVIENAQGAEIDLDENVLDRIKVILGE